MTNDMVLPFSFPAVSRKKVIAAFDGGRISADGGVMLLAAAERRLGIAEKLAAVIPDPRDPVRTIHPLPDILRARIFAIACGYEDADDLDSLRTDPALKLACGRLPDSGVDLCSQPTVSRWENAPGLRDVIRMARVDPHGPRHGRSLVRQLHPAAPVRYPRHRRRPRRGAWPSAAVAVQRPLRRALLLAPPCLRHPNRPARRRSPAPGQDPDRGGSAGPSPSACSLDPAPLADNPHHPPRRCPLRPARSDGLVRSKRRRLHVRSGRLSAAPG